MAKADEQTNVRLPVHLKQWLREQAAAARRSITAELVFRLEQSRKAQEAQHEKQA